MTLKPSSICSTCGGVVIDENLLLGATLGLTPIHARIFATMAKHREIPLSRLIELTHGGPDGGCNNATMQTHIHNINKIIKKLNLRIRANRGDPFTTYRLLQI